MLRWLQALIARETFSPTSHSLSGSRPETGLHGAEPVWSRPSIEASSAKPGWLVTLKLFFQQPAIFNCPASTLNLYGGNRRMNG